MTGNNKTWGVNKVKDGLGGVEKRKKREIWNKRGGNTSSLSTEGDRFYEPNDRVTGGNYSPDRNCRGGGNFHIFELY